MDIEINSSLMSEAQAKAEADRLNAATPSIPYEALQAIGGTWGVVVIVEDTDGRRPDRWVAW